MKLVNGHWVSDKKSASTSKEPDYQDLEEMLAAIKRKEVRLKGAGYDDLAKPTKKEPSVWERGINLLGTSEEASAKTVRDLLLEGQLPTGQEYKDVASTKTYYDYTKLLEELGVPAGKGRSIAGFGLGIVADPLTYLPVGTLGKIASKFIKPVAKAARPLVKVAKAIPGVRKGVEMLEGLPEAVKAYRGVASTGDKGIDTIMTRLGGLSGAREFEKANIRKQYPVLEKVSQVLKKKDITDFVHAYEDKAWRKTLPANQQKLIKELEPFFKETGLEKQSRGIIEGLVGEQTFQPMLPMGAEFTSHNAQMMYKYWPHLQTPDAKRWLQKQSPDPEEQKAILAGLMKPALAKAEKSRTIRTTIDDFNSYFKEKNKVNFDFFETDPTKALNQYVHNYATNKVLVDMAEEFKGIVDDMGKPVIQKLAGGEVPEGLVKLTGLPFEEGYATTPEIAKRLNRVVGVFSSDVEMNKVLSGFDRVMSIWKKLVTVPWPQFNINNLIGATFNNFIEDADTLKNYDKAFRFIKGQPLLLRAVNGATMTRDDLLREMSKRGALLNFASNEGMDIMSKIGKVKGLKQISSWPSGIEGVVRSNLFMTKWMKTGNLDEAARAVWRVHGNYADEFMKGWEKGVANRVFPFYKWMKTSIPFQIENLYNKTGKYAAVAKLQNRIVNPAEREEMPPWLREKMIVTAKDIGAGEKAVRTLELPLMDMVKYTDPRLLFQSVTPLAKAMAEGTFNKQLFTGKEIVDETLPKAQQTTTVYKVLSNLPQPIKTWLNYQENKVFNKAKGQYEVRYEADGKKMYLLTNTLGPLTRAYYGTRNMERELEVQGITDPSKTESLTALAGSMLSPSKAYTYSPKEQEFYAAQARQAELQNRINWLLKRNKIERAR